MLLRKQEIKCEKCKTVLHNIPLYLHNFRIDIVDNPLAFEKIETLKGNLIWNCPICNYLNSESIEAILDEDAYISIITDKYKGYSKEEVRYV